MLHTNAACFAICWRLVGRDWHCRQCHLLVQGNNIKFFGRIIVACMFGVDVIACFVNTMWVSILQGVGHRFKLGMVAVIVVLLIYNQ